WTLAHAASRPAEVERSRDRCTSVRRSCDLRLLAKKAGHGAGERVPLVTETRQLCLTRLREPVILPWHPALRRFPTNGDGPRPLETVKHGIQRSVGDLEIPVGALG